MWTNDYAAKLREHGDLPALGVPAEDELLDFTREVAHGSERKNGPLATFLAGWFVGVRVAEGVDPREAWNEAAALGRQLLEGEAVGG